MHLLWGKPSWHNPSYIKAESSVTFKIYIKNLSTELWFLQPPLWNRVQETMQQGIHTFTNIVRVLLVQTEGCPFTPASCSQWPTRCPSENRKQYKNETILSPPVLAYVRELQDRKHSDLIRVSTVLHSLSYSSLLKVNNIAQSLLSKFMTRHVHRHSGSCWHILMLPILHRYCNRNQGCF